MVPRAGRFGASALLSPKFQHTMGCPLAKVSTRTQHPLAEGRVCSAECPVRTSCEVTMRLLESWQQNWKEFLSRRTGRGGDQYVCAWLEAGPSWQGDQPASSWRGLRERGRDRGATVRWRVQSLRKTYSRSSRPMSSVPMRSRNMGEEITSCHHAHLNNIVQTLPAQQACETGAAHHLR